MNKEDCRIKMQFLVYDLLENLGPYAQHSIKVQQNYNMHKMTNSLSPLQLM